MAEYTSNGGGATHIAKVTGQLKDLSSNLSDILMVSGGGGGGLLVGDTDYSGKDAGGISGSGDNSADQSTGNAFGQGESGTNVSGGGGGLYGGYKGTSAKSGGAGSGYIGNSLVNNKKMVGFNVPTSSDASTKTESVNVYSASRESNKPKAGDGFARIKLLADYTEYNLSELVKTMDINHKKETGWNESSIYTKINDLSSYFGSDWILVAKQSNGNYFTAFDGNSGIGRNATTYTGILIYIPIKPILVKRANWSVKFNSGQSSQWTYLIMYGGYIDSNNKMQTPLIQSQNYTSSWVTKEKVYDTPQRLEYICVGAGDYQWSFKDFKITGRLLD